MSHHAPQSSPLRLFRSLVIRAAPDGEKGSITITGGLAWSDPGIGARGADPHRPLRAPHQSLAAGVIAAFASLLDFPPASVGGLFSGA